MVILADLAGGEVEQTLLESVAQAVVTRGATVLSDEAVALSPRALRLDLADATGVSIEEAYEVVDGALIGLYDEDDALRQGREATYSGTSDAYASTVTAVARGGEDGGIGTPEAAATSTVAYGTTLLSFLSAEDAESLARGSAGPVDRGPAPGLSLLLGRGRCTGVWGRVGDVRLPAPGRGRCRPRVPGLRPGRSGGRGDRVCLGGGDDLGGDRGVVTAQIACLEIAACPSDAPIPGARQGRTPDERVATAEGEPAADDGAIRREGRDQRTRPRRATPRPTRPRRRRRRRRPTPPWWRGGRRGADRRTGRRRQRRRCRGIGA
jgi:hypothetical protein